MPCMWWGLGGLVPNTRLEKNVGGWKLHARWAPSVVSLFFLLGALSTAVSASLNRT
jgi:hypothetical protein